MNWNRLQIARVGLAAALALSLVSGITTAAMAQGRQDNNAGGGWGGQHSSSQGGA